MMRNGMRIEHGPQERYAKQRLNCARAQAAKRTLTPEISRVANQRRLE